MTLKDIIQEDVKDAMRLKDQPRRDAIRLLLAAIKQREVDERITLDDPGILNVIDKMIKQRRDSIAQFEKASRQDLVDQEKFEISVLNKYLPEPLTEKEIVDHIALALKETGATSMKDMGSVMALLKPKLQGRTDMAEVSKKIKSALESH